MLTSRKQHRVALVSLLFALAACRALPGGPAAPTPFPGVPDDAQGDPTPTPQPRAALFSGGEFKPGRVFEATTWTESGRQFTFAPETGFVITMLLYDDGDLWARTGCGSLTGRWSVANGLFVVMDFARNRNLMELSCGSQHMIEDDRNAVFLTSSPAYAEAGASLVLSTESTALAFIERPPATPQANWPWTLKSASSDGVSIHDARRAGTLEFLNDHTARWTVGSCVLGAGPMTELDDASIRMEIDTSSRPCRSGPIDVTNALTRLMSADRVTYDLDPPRLAMAADGVELVFEILDE